MSKSRSCQTLSESSAATTQQKKALIPNSAGVSQLTQSKCCRLEGRISLCKVTSPISTDRVTLIGGPAIISPFISLTDNQERQHMVPLLLLLIFLSADSEDSLTANRRSLRRSEVTAHNTSFFPLILKSSRNEDNTMKTGSSSRTPCQPTAAC